MRVGHAERGAAQRWRLAWRARQARQRREHEAAVERGQLERQQRIEHRAAPARRASAAPRCRRRRGPRAATAAARRSRPACLRAARADRRPRSRPAPARPVFARPVPARRGRGSRPAVAQLLRQILADVEQAGAHRLHQAPRKRGCVAAASATRRSRHWREAERAWRRAPRLRSGRGTSARPAHQAPVLFVAHIGASAARRLRRFQFLRAARRRRRAAAAATAAARAAASSPRRRSSTSLTRALRLERARRRQPLAHVAQQRRLRRVGVQAAGAVAGEREQRFAQQRVVLRVQQARVAPRRRARRAPP